MILPVLKFPDGRLRKVSKAVSRVTSSIRTLVGNMLETMYHEGGIGLAAIQVGIPKRIMVIDISESEVKSPMCIINPVIQSYSKETCLFLEGCLSIPGQRVELERPNSVQLRYLDENGNACSMIAKDLLARVIQHENDHLMGRLLIDYVVTQAEFHLKAELN